MGLDYSPNDIVGKKVKPKEKEGGKKKIKK